MKREYECEVCKYRWDAKSAKHGDCGRVGNPAQSPHKGNLQAPVPPSPEARKATRRTPVVSPVRYETSTKKNAPDSRMNYLEAFGKLFD
jgi:hypothetical protein